MENYIAILMYVVMIVIVISVVGETVPGVMNVVGHGSGQIIINIVYIYVRYS